MWGLAGIISAGAISFFLIMGVWKPYFLYNKGFNESVWNYWPNWLLLTVVNVASFFIAYAIMKMVIIDIYTFLDWILYACVTAFIYLTTSIIIMLSANKYSRRLLKRLNIIRL